ncbi:UNVERIFIED_CONTAM: hypothetical protein GTU68_045916, partial [Idotea baltica]|nr:hypothetical protein [Idotea baltica]
MDEMETALAESSDLPTALLFLDLDDFKDVNDSLGHEAGDALLVTIAERLVRAIRHGDTAARIGGDEFAVLVPAALGETSVIELAERILGELSQPLLVGSRAVNCKVSVGVAIDNDGSATPELLLRNADVAMYRAKDRGKGRIELYEEHLHTSVFHRFELKNDLQRGLDNGELRVVYQPLVDMATATIRGAEALVRWQHPTKGLLSPIDFIPVAEASGMIVELGSQVLDAATSQLAHWDSELMPGMRMSVNVSVRQLESGALIGEVEELINSKGITAAQLCLEITESVFMSDPVGTAAQFAELRALGVKIAIDDFGTGYSSLRHVQEYPFDVLKIDKSFV